MDSECDSCDCYKAHDNSKWKIFKKKGMRILYLNINSLQAKIDEVRFIANQSNAFIIGICESKLDSSILNKGLDISDYDLLKLDRSRRGVRVVCYIRKSLSYDHKTSFCRNIESIFMDVFLPKSHPILVGVLYRPLDKLDFIENFNNNLKESNISDTQECYLVGDFNVNLLSVNKMLLEKQHFDLIL